MSAKEKIIATIHYRSGRTETISGKLRSNGQPYKTFEEKLDQFRRFPTVERIETETY